MTSILRVSYGERSLECAVREREGWGRRLRIHVAPDGRITVDAPSGASRTELKAGVTRRGRWICAQLEAVERRHEGLLPRDYVSGESHLYLGRRHLLKRLPADGEGDRVRLRHGQLQVRCAEPDAASVKALLQVWYLARAAEVLPRRIEALGRSLPWVDDPPKVRLRAMSSRWGTCSPGGVVTLNPVLIKAPTACIDGVLVHELCHLKLAGHGPAFYRRLDRALPDWRECKARLDDMVERLMLE